MQNRAARIITKSDYDTDAGPLIDKLGWKTIRELNNNDAAVMMLKIMNNMAPPYLTGMFQVMCSNTFLRVLNASESFCAKTLAKTYIQHRHIQPYCSTSHNLGELIGRIPVQFYFLRTSSRQADFLCAAAKLCKLEEFQLIILFCIFILVLNQHRKFNSLKSLSAHYPILVSIL